MNADTTTKDRYTSIYYIFVLGFRYTLIGTIQYLYNTNALYCEKFQVYRHNCNIKHLVIYILSDF